MILRVLLLLLPLLSVVSTQQCFAITVMGLEIESQEDVVQNATKISLNTALKMALNNSEVIKNLKEEFLFLQSDWQGQIESFFLPGVSLDFSSSFTKHIKDLGDETPKEEINKNPYPSNSVALNIGSYTIFNWGSDWNGFKQNYNAQQSNILNFRKSLFEVKIQIINSYFNLRQAFDTFTENWYFFKMRSLMFEISKEKLMTGEIEKKELDNLELELVNEALNIKAEINDFKEKQVAFAMLIGSADKSQMFEPINEVPYIPLPMTQNAVLALAKKTCPDFQIAKFTLLSAESGYNATRKGLLPLPVLTFDGLNLTLNEQVPGDELGRERTWSEAYTLKMGVSASLSIPLIGADGFFQYRTIRRALTDIRKARLNYKQTVDNINKQLINFYQAIKNQEIRIKLATKAREKGTELMQQNIANLLARKFDKEEMLELAGQIKEAMNSYRSTVYSHLTNRLDLALLLVVPHLPGKRSAKYTVIP